MEKQYKILVVDDEPDIIEFISYNLKKEHFRVVTAQDGMEAIQVAKRENPDLIMLDIMMPKLDGIAVCEHLRQLPEFKNTLVLFLTAMGDEQSEIKGLNVGADDYIVKPIKPKLLITRVKTLLRRLSQHSDKPQKIEIGDLEIDPEKYRVLQNGNELILPKKEFELLQLLAEKPGKVYHRDEILNRVWGTEVIVGDRTIDVHIRKLRQKLGEDLIVTVKGVGYKFEA